MLRRWLRSKFFAGRRVNISSGVPAVLLESVPVPAFLSREAELSARQQEDIIKNKLVCFSCGTTGHKKANCPVMAPGKASEHRTELQPLPSGQLLHLEHESGSDSEKVAPPRSSCAASDDIRNSTMALWDMPYVAAAARSDQTVHIRCSYAMQIQAKHACLLQSLGAVTTAFLNQVKAAWLLCPHVASVYFWRQL
jgi:hypothetical protein